MSYRTLGALTHRLNARRLREDWHFGMLCAAVANTTGGKGKGQPFQPADFFPALRTAKKKPASPKALAAYADFMNVWANAKAAAEKKK